MNTVPLIGIAGGNPEAPNLQGEVIANDRQQQRCIEAFQSLNASCLVIPLQGESDPLTFNARAVDEIFNKLDGLYLPGGEDIHKSIFKPAKGELPTPSLRDLQDLYLARRALAANVPLLGSCRGMQIMNIAQGGTIERVPRHCLPEQKNKLGAVHHAVFLDEDSQTARELGQDWMLVNSYHSWALRKLGVGIKVVGYSEDDVIEFIEVEGKLARGTQAHPESLYKTQAWARREIGSLIAAAAEFKLHRETVVPLESTSLEVRPLPQPVLARVA